MHLILLRAGAIDKHFWTYNDRPPTRPAIYQVQYIVKQSNYRTNLADIKHSFQTPEAKGTTSIPRSPSKGRCVKKTGVLLAPKCVNFECRPVRRLT